MIASRLGAAEFTRIGELRQVAAISFEVLDAFVRADKDDDALASFICFADLDDLHPRGFRCEGSVVAHHLGVVGEPIGYADVMAQDVLRARERWRFLGDGQPAD